MNRRGFLSSLIAVPAAAWFAPSSPWVLHDWHGTKFFAADRNRLNLGQEVCAVWTSIVGGEDAFPDDESKFMMT